MVLGNGSTFPKHILYLFYPKYSGYDVHYNLPLYAVKIVLKHNFLMVYFLQHQPDFCSITFCFKKSAKAKIIVIFLCFMA